MPAPFGGTLTDDPEFTANEIYEINVEDPCQGAGAGALFGGIGIQNQPHQQLANRTAFLYGRQNTNIANIGALQAFVGLFTGSISQGYIKIPFMDSSHGPIELIVQWGWYSWSGLSQSQVGNQLFTFAWPTPFLNECTFQLASLTTNDVTSAGGLNQAALNLEPVGPPYSLTQGKVFSDYNDQAGAIVTIAVLTGAPSPGLTGFTWLAIGY